MVTYPTCPRTGIHGGGTRHMFAPRTSDPQPARGHDRGVCYCVCMNRHIVPALALAAACTTVGACSTNQDTGDNPATGVSASPTVDKGPVDPHTTVVDDTAAPQGYSMDSINQMIQDQEAESPGINQDMVSMAQEVTADPAECAALVPTGVTYISKIVQNPDAIAARDFTNESTDATLSVAVSSDPQLLNHPRDVSVCESITRAHAGGSTSYTAAPMELRVDGADSVTAAEVTLTQSSSPLSGDNGSVSRIAYVEIDGATYTVSGSPEVAPEEFTRMVQAQAEKIRQR